MALRGKKKLMIEALKAELGGITAAAKQIGICRETHYLWMKKDEEYKKEVETMPDLVLDFVENALFKLIEKGNPPAIIFFLKTKGRGRGYIEKQEIDHSLSESPNVNINIIKPYDENNKLQPNEEAVSGVREIK